MDRNECFKEYWEKHPDEEKLWMEVTPFIVGFQYGIQSNEFLEVLKMFSPDNPEVLFSMHDFHIVNKRIPEVIESVNKLKELYPKYNEDWNFRIEWINHSKTEIMEVNISGKIEGMLEFKRHLNGNKITQSNRAES